MNYIQWEFKNLKKFHIVYHAVMEKIDLKKQLNLDGEEDLIINIV